MALTALAQPSAESQTVRDDRVRIVAFGDSTTAPRGTLAVYAGLLEQDLPARGVKAEVINAGVGGHCTRLGRQRFKTDVLDRKPVVVIIQFGINDSAVDVWKTPPITEPRVTLADYRANLEFFVDSLQAAGARVVLMTPNPMRWTERDRRRYDKPPYQVDDPDGFNVLLKQYAESARQVARERKVALVDIYAEFQAFNGSTGQSMDDLLLDGIHPNARGQRLIADLLLATLPALLKP
jgi:lysophospholipase L1-like esterase